MSQNNKDPNIRLTAEDYFDELEALTIQGIISLDVEFLLKDLISTHILHHMPLGTTPFRLNLAKQFLQGGIILVDRTNSENWYDVVYYDPDDKVRGRSFFYLLPKYPNGTFKRLDQ